MREYDRVFILGGSGFIGSHIVARLLQTKNAEQVTVFDNFSSGRREFLKEYFNDQRLHIIEGDAKTQDQIEKAIGGHDLVIHLAANPDIAKAIKDPDIDFREGTLLTRNLLESMRKRGVSKLVYTSGSGVYGDIGETVARESHGPLIPISTYAASKLACEALISSYCFMFGLQAWVCRFANVVGPRQTHGVGYDFIRRLIRNSKELSILGDGSQSKSYIHVDDVISAIEVAMERATAAFQVFNVATGDYITVREIAELAVKTLRLNPNEVSLHFSGGDRGWKGDVPIVRLSTELISLLGWKCNRSSKQAIQDSLNALAIEARLEM